MEAQETKFSFVYHEVKQRILTNQIPPGDYMPSSRILCHQFNVSRYTINRVFEALQKEGYIEIKPRIAPIVLPREAVIQQENEGITFCEVVITFYSYIDICLDTSLLVKLCSKAL